MFAATKRLLVTLALVATVCGFGTGQEISNNRSTRSVVEQPSGNRGHRLAQSSGQAHQHENSRPMGLLDRLRSIGGGGSKEPHDSAESSSDRSPADWTGIPYHEPKRSTTRGRSEPITDPTRIASRNRSNARVAVSPRTRASSSSPSTVQVPLGVGRIPTPPAEISGPKQPTRPATESPASDVSRPSFSPTYSSRRSNRRPVTPLSDVAASPSDRAAKNSTEKKEALATATRNPVIDVDSDDHLAPRVRQQPVPTRDAAGPSNSVAGNEQPADSSAPVPPSLAVDSGNGKKAAETAVPAQDGKAMAKASPTEIASAGAAHQTDTDNKMDDAETVATSTSSNATPAPQSAASPTEIGAIEQLQPVGSGVGRARSTVSADSATGSFKERNSKNNGEGATSTSTAVSGFRSEAPAIRVVAAGPSEIMIRQQTPYEIHVENRGSIDASGVLVRAQLPIWAKVRKQTESAGEISQNKQDNAQELMWQIEDLPAGAKEKLVLELQAEQSGTFEVNVDWTLLPRKEVMQVNVREPKLELVIEGPDQVTYGESETYRVRVLNPGSGVAPDVVFTLSPNSATPQSQEIGDIPPGKEAEFEVQLTAQDLGTLEIHGLATSELALRTEETKKIQIASAKLEATLSGPPLKYQDGEATYQLQVRNVGSAPSQNVVASLQLPSGLKYLDGLKEAKVKDELLTWTIDQLDADASRDYQIRCQMASTGTHRLAFQCEGSAAGKTAVSIDTKVEALADLVLTVNDPSAPAPVGEEVSYEIIIRNRGSKAATGVNAITHFSENIEPLRTEGHRGKVTTGQVEFETIERIEAGQEITLRVIAQADRDGLHRFRSEISSADTVLVAEEATRFMNANTEQISRRSSESESR